MSIKRFESHSTIQYSIVFQHYYLSCCNYLLKMTVNSKQLKEVEFHSIKDVLSSLRKVLATESPLKMMKKVFYFTLKALLPLKIFKLLS